MQALQYWQVNFILLFIKFEIYAGILPNLNEVDFESLQLHFSFM